MTITLKYPHGIDNALTIPGVANSLTMPIKARIDMLSAGIRTPVGIKILGPNLGESERRGLELIIYPAIYMLWRGRALEAAGATE